LTLEETVAVTLGDDVETFMLPVIEDVPDIDTEVLAV